jgi:hypothetical protein
MRRGPGVTLAIILGLAAACGGAQEPPPVSAAVHAAAASGGACHHATPSCGSPPPTYVADVRPILEQRCFKCHAGGGIAADEHDFSRVETLRAQKRALANEIGECAMPPSSEPAVPDAEAEVLLRWAACGGA